MAVLIKKIIFFILFILLLNSCNSFSSNIKIQKESLLKVKHNSTNKNNNDKIYISNLNKKIIKVNYDYEYKNEKLIDILSNNTTNESNTTNGSNNLRENLEDKMFHFNYFHIFISFLLIPFLSILLLIYDLCEDKKIVKKYNLSKIEKANEEFQLLKKTYIAKGRYLFSWFLMKYKYPLANIFSIYNFDHQRYIRLMIFTVKILLNLLITAIIFFNSSFKVDKGPKCIFISLLMVLSHSLVINLITEITINYLLDYDKVRRSIFKPKFENLRKYAYYIIKKDILFNSKWHLIRNRMISYYRICGPLILRKYKKNKNDKYERYTKNKNINIRGILSDIQDSFNSSIVSNDNEKESLDNSGLKEKLLLSISSSLKMSPNNIFYKNDSFKKQKKILRNENDKNKNLFITKGVEPFSFSRFGVNNMKLKTLKKIEDIRTRYIANKNKIKYDETLDVDAYVKTFDNLDIEALENYTYISTDAMINKLNKINSNSNKLILNLFTNVILFILLILMNIALVLLYNAEEADAPKNNNEYDDFESAIRFYFYFLFSEIIIIDFFIYKIICSFISVFLPKMYGYKKKNCFYKMIFDLFFEKYIRYLYRMRLLINKYHKEFNFIEN